MAKYGKNKEGDSLSQINLARLCGEESMHHVCYRKLSRNITDVKIIENLVEDVDFRKLEKLKLVLNTGSCSEKRLDEALS